MGDDLCPVCRQPDVTIALERLVAFALELEALAKRLGSLPAVRSHDAMTLALAELERREFERGRDGWPVCRCGVTLVGVGEVVEGKPHAPTCTWLAAVVALRAVLGRPCAPAEPDTAEPVPPR